MNNPRRFLYIFFVCTAFGVIGVLNVFGSSALPKIRTVDVVRLIGMGMCFGVALCSLFIYFRIGIMKNLYSRQ